MTVQISINVEYFSLVSSTEDFNSYGFISRVEDITRTFQGISVDQIRVRYLDDENCYVNLEEALMGELFRCARDVPGTWLIFSRESVHDTILDRLLFLSFSHEFLSFPHK